MENLLITTAISYTNGNPHVGHLYESILADFLKKSHSYFYNTKLLTGTDEHGKKIESTAIEQNITPKTLCDINSDKFKVLNNKLNVDYDHFIRTTDPEHVKLVIDSIIKSFKNNDIYLSQYSGYYNVREECFISEIDASQTNYRDPMTDKPYEKITEESYFFKLEKYKDFILKKLENNLVFPQNKFSFDNRIDDLKDLSISRTSFDWGISFPSITTENKHIVYVWFDALLNYVTGANILYPDTQHKTIHLIGKDILWFHAVIYQAILKSINNQNNFADTIMVHGFILDKSGLKMSKSLNNVVDVNYIMDKYPIDAIRYYLIMETNWGDDIKFNEDRIKELYNNQLIKDFGNLFQRMFTLCKPIQNDINEYNKTNNKDLIEEFDLFKKDLHQNVTTHNHSNYKALILNLCQYCNKELTDKKPWDKSVDHNDKVILLSKLLIKLTCIMKLLYPIIPNKIVQLYKYLGYDLNLDNYDVTLNITENKIKAFDPIL